MLCNLQSSPAVGGRIDHVSDSFQLKPQQIQDIFRIFDDQYACHVQQLAIFLPVVLRDRRLLETGGIFTASPVEIPLCSG